MLRIGHVRLDNDEIDFHFVRSSGAGGQNVNKVSTKAVLRWHFTASKIPTAVKERFASKWAHRINAAGDILITSDRYRDQPRNIADAMAKLSQLIEAVLTPPKPRKKTKPSGAAVERRLRAKKERATNKNLRRKVSDSE